MQGYINDTLSTAYLTHPAVRKDFLDDQMLIDNKINVTQCRWEDQLTVLSPNIQRNHSDLHEQDKLYCNCMSHVCAAIETTGVMRTTL